jgi:hypothetical protein
LQDKRQWEEQRLSQNKIIHYASKVHFNKENSFKIKAETALILIYGCFQPEVVIPDPQWQIKSLLRAQQLAVIIELH